MQNNNSPQPVCRSSNVVLTQVNMPKKKSFCLVKIHSFESMGPADDIHTNKFHSKTFNLNHLFFSWFPNFEDAVLKVIMRVQNKNGSFSS